MSNLKDNKRYKNLVMEDQAAYLPDLSIDYPEDNSKTQLVEIVYDTDRRISFDDTYPYFDKSWNYKWNHFKCYLTLFGFVFWANKLCFGVKVKNRSVLRRYRKEFRNGAITLCNHVYRWDLPCVLYAIRYRQIWVPILAEHLMGTEKWYMRYIGGVPVPDNPKGTRAFYKAFDELHERKQWIHFFPEARSWKFYTPIRPFQKGAFTMAYKYGMPIIPCVISYRERKGIYKLFGKPEVPLITLTMCEPIFPDTTAPRKDEIDRLRNLAHSEMVKTAGIKENTWPSATD